MDRSAAMITLKAILVQAPGSLRAEPAREMQKLLARYCAALRPRTLETPDDSIRHTLRSIAKRWITLGEEAKELVAMIEQFVIARTPQLLDEFGIGVNAAPEVLIVAGDNSERI